jgi:hypothetical protein
MKVVKKTSKYSLNKGTLQADGLFNVSENKGNGLSFWLDDETVKTLRKMKAKEFNDLCEKLVKE